MEGGIDAGTTTTRIAARDAGGTVVVRALPDGASLLDARTGDRPAARPRADIPAGLLGAVEGDFVAAVPDSWLDGSVGGAVAAETMRDVLAAELERPPRRLVPHSLAAVAAVGDREPVLVCDVGAHTLSATLAGGDRSVDTESAGGPLAERAGAGFAARVLGELASEPPAWRALATAQERAGRRAALVLARAFTHARYHEAPVYRLGVGGGERVLTAGEVLSAFAPVRDAIAGMLARLLARHPEAAGERPRLAIAGGFAAFGLVRDALLDALPWSAEPPLVLGPGAVARGALALAEDPAREPYPHALALPLHRLRRGRLESVRMPLADAGEPLPLAVQAGGEPLIVEVAATHGLRLAVEARERGRGDFRPLALPRMSLPPGRYGVGLLPARTGFGTLVLRPQGGGEPVICPLEER